MHLHKLLIYIGIACCERHHKHLPAVSCTLIIAAIACFEMKLRHLCFTVVLLSISISCCRGQGGAGGGGGGAGGAAGGAVVPGTQDAIQIVAQAALCFDNRQVINGCLQSMGLNVSSNGSGGTSTAAPPALAPAPGPSAAGTGTGTNNGSTNVLCQGPCFGQMMLMMTCVNGILGNIQGYSPGLMQGVQAIFQMSCGNVGSGQGSGGAGGSGAGGAGGGGAGGGAGGGGGGGAGGGGGTGSSAVVASGSHVAVSNIGEQTSNAAGPTASVKSGFPSMLNGNCIWLLLLLYLAL